MIHEMHTAHGARSWQIDLLAAERSVAWVKRQPGVLVGEIQAMATYFPHWVLVGSHAGKLLRCVHDQALCAPMSGGFQCIVCSRPAQGSGLCWIGHVPVLARPEPNFVKRQPALRAAGFDLATSGNLTYELVPLTVTYPAEWPNEEPHVRYARPWLAALGLPHASAAYHLIEQGRACLFAWGQWQAMTVAAVLQQRVVNHITSLFKIVAGQSPQQAFIGRIDHQDWQPERP